MQDGAELGKAVAAHPVDIEAALADTTAPTAPSSRRSRGSSPRRP
jgi:hypothetical protein